MKSRAVYFTQGGTAYAARIIERTMVPPTLE
jgi:hypothetical protein